VGEPPSSLLKLDLRPSEPLRLGNLTPLFGRAISVDIWYLNALKKTLEVFIVGYCQEGRQRGCRRLRNGRYARVADAIAALSEAVVKKTVVCSRKFAPSDL